jgi:hypothetical protein
MNREITWSLFRVECPAKFVEGPDVNLWLKNQTWTKIIERIGEDSHLELRKLANSLCSKEQREGNTSMTCRFDLSIEKYDRDFRTIFSEPFIKIINGTPVSVLVQFILQPHFT